MCRCPCTAIPTRTGARCDCASPGETPGSPAADDDGVVATPSAAVPAPSAGDGNGDDSGNGEEPGGGEGSGDGSGDPAETAPAALSEAEAELAAQRELRERIEKRKAEKEGPIAAGGS